MSDKTCVAVQKRTTRPLSFFPRPFFHLKLKTGQMSSFVQSSHKWGNAMMALTDGKGAYGIVLHSAAGYDWLVWLATFGRERAFREKLLCLARLGAGESVLDVGCGTGTLAIAARRVVGAVGRVYGIDASPEMIARAEKKATKAGIEVVFQNSLAQALPFPDAQFDAVLSTVMLHHLPRKVREEAVAEMRRVLKPGGRVLAVDFGENIAKKKSLLDHFHRRHGHVALSDILALLGGAGLKIIESGAVGSAGPALRPRGGPMLRVIILIGGKRAEKLKERPRRTMRPG
jgi:ubiquinone/menaquinone biosynthesis C-methylase UbiE